MVYCRNGAGLGEIMDTPPANAGSCYINHTGDNYEPILEFTVFNSDKII